MTLVSGQGELWSRDFDFEDQAANIHQEQNLKSPHRINAHDSNIKIMNFNIQGLMGKESSLEILYTEDKISDIVCLT